MRENVTFCAYIQSTFITITANMNTFDHLVRVSTKFYMKIDGFDVVIYHFLWNSSGYLALDARSFSQTVLLNSKYLCFSDIVSIGSQNGSCTSKVSNTISARLGCLWNIPIDVQDTLTKHYRCAFPNHSIDHKRKPIRNKLHYKNKKNAHFDGIYTKCFTLTLCPNWHHLR